MTEKLIAIYYPYALALSSHDYSGLYTDDIEIVGEWLANNHVKSVEARRCRCTKRLKEALLPRRVCGNISCLTAFSCPTNGSSCRN